MELEASSLGKLFFEKLVQQPTITPVHANMEIKNIFRNTIYIHEKTSDEMFIISNYRWRSHYIINIKSIKDVDFRRLVEPGAEISLETETRKIIIRNKKLSPISISLGNAHIYDQTLYTSRILRAKKYVLKNIEKLARITQKMYSYIDVIATVYDDQWYKEYNSIKQALEGKGSNARHIAGYLLGRGTGFTPAGDDVLQGMIMAVNIVDKVIDTLDNGLYGKEFLSAVENMIRDPKITTWASRNYLKYALKGLYDELPLRLVYHLFLGNEGKVFDDLVMLTRRGHNSGLYISLGFMWGFYYSITRNNITTSPDRIGNL